MKELLLSLGGILLALLGWWIKDQPRRMRLKLLEEIEDLEDEAKLALANRDADRLAIVHNRLLRLRTKSRVIAGK